MSEIKTFDECCKEVAKKKGFGDLVTGHLKKYYSEAAEIYASQYKAKVDELGKELQVLKSEHDIWEKHSLVKLVSERDALKSELTSLKQEKESSRGSYELFVSEIENLKQEKERLVEALCELKNHVPVKVYGQGESSLSEPYKIIENVLSSLSKQNK